MQPPRTPDTNAAVLSVVGTTIADRFEVQRWIGSGSMGDVYEANDASDGTVRALKLLGPEFRDRSNLVERFMREANAASKVRHPNVVDIVARSEPGETPPFLAMELLRGRTVRELLDESGALPWPRVRGLMRQILAGLEAAHSQGLVHRDLKPANCFLVDSDGRTDEAADNVKVLDFGIAKVIGDEVSSGTLSRTGTVMGTAHYMSPEQVNSEELDPRSDLYAAGVMMFEMLTGCVPFDAPGFMGILVRHVEAPVPKMSDVAPGITVAPAVEAIVRRALEKKRDDRWSNAREFSEALEQAEDEGESRPSLSRLAVPLVIVIAVLGLVAAWALT